MNIAFGVIAFILLLYIAMILVRKSLWDVVHRNMLDIEDNYHGKVIRSGFAARPVFKGIFNGKDISINFSSAKSKSGRKTYIDFSLTNASESSFTIAEKNWLEEEGNNSPSLNNVIELENKTSYVILSSEQDKIKKLINKKSFKQLLGSFENLTYFFVGKTGTICEFWSTQIDKDTQFDKMKSRLENINKLLNLLK